MVPVNARAAKPATRRSLSSTTCISRAGGVGLVLCLCVAGPGVASAEPHDIRTAAVQSDEAASDGLTEPFIRTIEIDVGEVSFNMKSVLVVAGETVRFVLRNTSAAPRDFTVGTPKMQSIRRGFLSRMISSEGQAIGPAERRKLESWNAILVLPGETRELVWTFDKVEDVEFGSNISGQYEAGMKGRFRTTPAAESEPEASPADHAADDDTERAPVREGQEGSKTVHPSVQHHVRLSAIRQRARSVRRRL